MKPSQTCPNCGIQKKKELSERIHNCSCGYKANRDVVAAQVMLNYALGAGTDLTKQGSDSAASTHCGGFKQLSEMKRQKPRVLFLDGRGSSLIICLFPREAHLLPAHLRRYDVRHHPKV